MNYRDRLLFSVVLVVGLAITSSLDAQVSFETAYGNGVHHYFNGEYQKAVDSLSHAINEDQQDPRSYYYRGLANEALGNSSEKDFQMGAQMEVVRGGRLSLVNDALERVQGYSRITIEDVRRNALLSASRSRFSEPVVVARPFPAAKDEVKTVSNTEAVKEPSPAESAPGQDVIPAARLLVPPIKTTETADKEAGETGQESKPAEDAPLKEIGFDSVGPAKDKAKSDVEDPFGADEAMKQENAKKEEGNLDESTSPFEESGEGDESKKVGEPVPSEDKEKEGVPDDPFDL